MRDKINKSSHQRSINGAAACDGVLLFAFWYAWKPSTKDASRRSRARLPAPSSPSAASKCATRRAWSSLPKLDPTKNNIKYK